jgi:hypothetical protein
MSNFLARCAAITLVGGGFAATGDLGWLAARGMRLVNARTVPSEQAAEPGPSPPQPVAGPWEPNRPAAPAQPAADPFRGPPAPSPPARTAEEAGPPIGGPERVDLATLRAGERVTIWIATSTGASPTCITCDLVHPAAGEALLVGRGLAPRRVTIRGGASTRAIIARGETLVIAPASHARHATSAGETLGPVTAIAIGR